MRRFWLPLLLALIAGAWTDSRAEGLGYRALFDTRFQSVAFRGVVLDSIPAGDVVTGPNGELLTPSGYAVRCVPGRDHCTFYRQGEAQRGTPWVTSVDLALWGLGVPGLSVRSTARVAADLEGTDAWPGTEPTFQAIEAFAEYARRAFTVQLGRTHEISRFGFVGFDGGRAQVRLLQRRLRATVYGGWGLARGIEIPATDPLLDPLNDFLPRRRQRLLGLGVQWSSSVVTGRVLYQREVDPRAEDFVSERVGAEAGFRLPLGLRLEGGADWDVAAGWWGSAEAELGRAIAPGRGSVAVGARRYRPHFDLWTIWGAFDPVPYRAAYGRVAVFPWSRLELRARGEVYDFANANAATPLVRTEDGGWRWSVGGTWRPRTIWSLRAGLHQEFGPGASSLGYEAALAADVRKDLRMSLAGSYLERPLELRFHDAEVVSVGLDVDWQARPELRLTATVQGLDEARNRPDAAALDWYQIRFGLRATFAFDSAPSPSPVPPAVLRIPERGGAR